MEEKGSKERAIIAIRKGTRPGIAHRRYSATNVDKRATFHQIAFKGALQAREERKAVAKEASRGKEDMDCGRAKACMP